MFETQLMKHGHGPVNRELPELMLTFVALANPGEYRLLIKPHRVPMGWSGATSGAIETKNFSLVRIEYILCSRDDTTAERFAWIREYSTLKPLLINQCLECQAGVVTWDKPGRLAVVSFPNERDVRQLNGYRGIDAKLHVVPVSFLKPMGKVNN